MTFESGSVEQDEICSQEAFEEVLNVETTDPFGSRDSIEPFVAERSR